MNSGVNDGPSTGARNSVRKDTENEEVDTQMHQSVSNNEASMIAKKETTSAVFQSQQVKLDDELSEKPESAPANGGKPIPEIIVERDS